MMMEGDVDTHSHPSDEMMNVISCLGEYVDFLNYFYFSRTG